MKRLLHYFLITFTYLTCYSQNTIQISNGSATEGLPLTVMIRLNNSNENGALLNLTMTPGSANIRDYEGYSSILSFQPGETTKTLIVQTTNDDIEEENETFFVNVGFFGSSTVSSATMTIMDNDGEIKQPTAPITPIAPITPPCANAPRLTYRAIESPNNCGETGKIELTCQNLPNGEYIVNTNNNTSLTMNVVNNIGTIDNLSAGTYNNLTVTYNNCTSNNNINITIENPTPPSLILSKIINPTTCEGTGEIQLTCQNLPNGEYVISTNSNTSLTMNVANNMGTIDNVFVGTYNNLKVTYNNCSSNSNININIEAPEAPSLTLNKVTNPTTCEGTGEIPVSYTHLTLPTTSRV